MTFFCTQPLFASALQFAFDKATTEGKITIGALAILSMFSWTVIITKGRQLWRARRRTKQFFIAAQAMSDPLEIYRNGQEFRGSPAFEVYATAAQELDRQLKH